MWKNERLEKWFYSYAGLLDTFETRFGKISNEEEESENEEEQLFIEKEKKRHEKYLKIGKDDAYKPLKRKGIKVKCNGSTR